MTSGRRPGSRTTTTAPINGVAMMAVRIGKSVTSASGVGQEEEEQRGGAEGDPDRVPADEPVLGLAEAFGGAPDQVPDSVHGPVDDPLVDVTVEEGAEGADRPVDGFRDCLVVVVAVPDDVADDPETGPKRIIGR